MKQPERKFYSDVSFILFIVTYSAVAITADSKFIPFGPTFESEDKAWEWLHFECDLWPVHKEIEVYAMQPGNVISFWND